MTPAFTVETPAAVTGADVLIFSRQSGGFRFPSVSYTHLDVYKRQLLSLIRAIAAVLALSLIHI
ncbi:hypothetical protein [Erwinia amylovora]